jgi:hypothetical protein
MSSDAPSHPSPGTLVPVAERRRIAEKYRGKEPAVLERKKLGKEDMERGFSLLNAALAREGIRATVNLVGGAVMLLVHDVRPTTRDIDGWVVPDNRIERHIRAVGVTLGDERWLNEQALMYFPDKHPGKGDFTPYRDYGNLSIQVADERTMFAMKALALRNPKDRRDFQYLAEILNVRTVKEAQLIIGRYYRELTPERIATIAGVLDEIDSGRR